MFEIVYLPHFGDLLMLVDDMGKVSDPPKRINPLASMFYPGTNYGDPIVGDVLLGKSGLFNGEPDVTGLFDPALNHFYNILINLKESYYGK